MKPLVCNSSIADSEMLCRAAFDAPAGTATEIMYMPAGLQTITPSQGGRSVTVQVRVDRAGAQALEAQRAALEAKGKRPYFDFNHEDREASFWPTKFFFVDGKSDIAGRGSEIADGRSEIGDRTPNSALRTRNSALRSSDSALPISHSEFQTSDSALRSPSSDLRSSNSALRSSSAARPPGIYARGEWSDLGGAAITGRRYRQFSPVFYVDDVKAKPARIVCRADAKPNMGGLVNDPAFHTILPFWAKDSAGAPSGATQPTLTNQMEDNDMAALQAKIQEQQREIDALAAADQRRRESDADAAVQKAVARGAIAARDEAARQSWKDLLVASPENAALLEKVPGHPALSTVGVTSAIAAKSAGNVAIGALSARDALKAYGDRMAMQRIEGISLHDKARLSREAAAIYAADVRGNPGLLDLPLIGANSIGTVSGTLVTQRTLEFLHFVFPVLSMITTDFSELQAQLNQTITTRSLNPPTVASYDVNTGYAQTDQSATDVSVTIDQHKYVQTTFNANVLSGTVRRLFDEFAQPNAYAMAKDMVEAVYALILNANYSSATTQGIDDFSRGDVIDMGTALTLRGVPAGSKNRALLLHSSYYAKLAKDSGAVLNAVTALAAFQRPEIIEEGVIPEMHGFKVIDAPNIPDNGENLVGAGFSKSALVLATRLPMDYTQVLPGASFGNVTVVTNPDSGFSVMQVEYVDHKLGTANQRLAWLYGKAKGQPNALQRLKSA